MNTTATNHVASTIGSMRGTDCESAVIAVAAWGRGGLHTLLLAGLIGKDEYDDSVRQINEAQAGVLDLMASGRREHGRRAA